VVNHIESIAFPKESAEKSHAVRPMWSWITQKHETICFQDHRHGTCKKTPLRTFEKLAFYHTLVVAHFRKARVLPYFSRRLSSDVLEKLMF